MLGRLTLSILRAGTQSFREEISLLGPQRRWYSNVIYNTVPQVSSVLVIVWSSLSIDLSRQVFERIKTVTSSDIVAEVGAVYHFKVDSINQFWILFLWF